MLRRIAIHTLYDWAKVLTYIADALAPARDEPWRERAWRTWDSQRTFQLPPPPADHNCYESHASRPLP